jgi:hypothetical protein
MLSIFGDEERHVLTRRSLQDRFQLGVDGNIYECVCLVLADCYPASLNVLPLHFNGIGFTLPRIGQERHGEPSFCRSGVSLPPSNCGSPLTILSSSAFPARGCPASCLYQQQIEQRHQSRQKAIRGLRPILHLPDLGFDMGALKGRDG